MFCKCILKGPLLEDERGAGLPYIVSAGWFFSDAGAWACRLCFDSPEKEGVLQLPQEKVLWGHFGPGPEDSSEPTGGRKAAVAQVQDPTGGPGRTCRALCTAYRDFCCVNYVMVSCVAGTRETQDQATVYGKFCLFFGSWVSSAFSTVCPLTATSALRYVTFIDTKWREEENRSVFVQEWNTRRKRRFGS